MREPLQLLPWLLSRASGVVALVLVTFSVLLGLSMAARVIRPRRRRATVRLHEHLALAALLAIGLHGVSLLADPWLSPGLVGVTVPLALGYRSEYTALGILAGYLILLLGPSFYVRRRIGPARWRRLHRLVALAWLLSVVHALGAGTDGAAIWLEALVLLPGAVVVYLVTLRLISRRSTSRRAAAGQRV